MKSLPSHKAMNEILDAPDQPHKPGRLYSRLSFGSAIATILLIGFLLDLLPTTLGYILFFTALASFFTGIGTTILSIRRKEPPSVMNAVGRVLNITLFIGALIFAILFGTAVITGNV